MLYVIRRTKAQQSLAGTLNSRRLWTHKKTPRLSNPQKIMHTLPMKKVFMFTVIIALMLSIMLWTLELGWLSLCVAPTRYNDMMSLIHHIVIIPHNITIICQLQPSSCLSRYCPSSCVLALVDFKPGRCLIIFITSTWVKWFSMHMLLIMGHTFSWASVSCFVHKQIKHEWYFQNMTSFT